MITHADVAVAEFLVEKTGALSVLETGMRRNPRGRPTHPYTLRLLLIGLLLSIQDRGVATVKGAHRTLTEELPLDEQLRLGVRRVVRGTTTLVTYRELVTQADRISDLLAYGELSTPDLDEEERRRRHGVVVDFSNLLMDAFDFGWEIDTYALDATGVWSWARGGKNRKDFTPAEVEGEDSALVDEVRELALHGEGSDGRPQQDDLDDSPHVRRRRRRDRTQPRKRPRGVAPVLVSADDGLGYTTSADPDAAWGFKTAKSGEREGFFGYHEHTLVMAPESRIEDDPKTLPPLVRRLELTPASEDVVDVSFRLIDTAPHVRHLIVDRHYHYKSVDRWKNELSRRGVAQHHDLRGDEQGFVDYQRVRWGGGHPHCLCAPDELGVIPTLPPAASREERQDFRDRIERRRAFALRIVNQPTGDGTVRCQCPALAGTVGCPLRPGTVEAAIEMGLPVIENPPSEELDGEPLPKICTQVTVQYRPPEKVRKLQQPFYWGSEKWQRMYQRRTYVEGTYGNRKNVSTENMRRGLFQRMGLPWANIVIGLVAASYNLRMLQSWHDRSGDGDPNHPLLQRDEQGRPWMYLDDDSATRIENLYWNTIGLGDEVSTITSAAQTLNVPSSSAVQPRH